MVQEFHVLRCFSCRTFQVQQVKKSKKWSCKMCGAKQSLIKEYVRGTGADCRRHVQKLNSLRGELLEVEHERAWTQWEKEEECEVEVGPGDETQSHEPKGPTQSVSRWSKYVDQKENEPGCNEDDEHVEEEGVYSDREQCRQHNNIRKRKKSFTSGMACGRYTVGRHEDMDTAHWGATGLPSRPHQHDDPFTSLPQGPRSSTGFPRTSTSQRTDTFCDSPAATLGSGTCSQSTGAYKQSCAELSTKLQPPGPLSSVSAPSFSPQHPIENKLETKDSKWARFLPFVCIEEDKDEGDGAEYADVGHSGLAQSPVMPVTTFPLKTTGCMSSRASDGALLDKVLGVEKVMFFEKLSHCVNGNVCKQPNSPTIITSRPFGSQKPVCVQPLPIKRPCPAPSISTLFHTDEDFDDVY